MVIQNAAGTTTLATGDAVTFGELANNGRRNGVAGLSDSHGGLGGF